MSAESQAPSNVETLLAADVIKPGLPDEYHAVFESLSDEELGLILVVKARLEGMKRRGAVPGEYEGFVAF
jgi:hypothetical protein